jgi:VWFA-related protein
MLTAARCAFLVLLLVPGPFSCLHAQTTGRATSQRPSITVPVVVHGKHGGLVPQLNASDFTLTDNTYPQTIQAFAPNTSLSLHLGLLFETGAAQSSTLREKVRATEQFLSGLLAVHASEAQPSVFVIQFNRDVDLLEDPSSSKSKEQQALSQVGVAQFTGDSNGVTATQISSGRKSKAKSGANLYDAIDLAATDVLTRPEGRKVLVVLSDGIDQGSKTTMNGAVEAAQRAGAAVYAIYFKGGRPPMEFTPGRRTLGSAGGYPGTYPGSYPGSYPGTYPGGYPGSYPAPSRERRADGRKILREICERTGGEVFDSRRQSLARIYAAIAAQLNSAYMLQYTPTPQAAADSGFHHIRLKPKQKGLSLQMTEGYWSGVE